MPENPFRVICVTPDTVVLDINNQQERQYRDCNVFAPLLLPRTMSALRTAVASLTSPIASPPRRAFASKLRRGLSNLLTLICNPQFSIINHM